MEAAKGASQNLCVAEQRFDRSHTRHFYFRHCNCCFIVFVGGQLCQKVKRRLCDYLLTKHSRAAQKGAMVVKYYVKAYANLNYFSS
jgi:hypothetical protein